MNPHLDNRAARALAAIGAAGLTTAAVAPAVHAAPARHPLPQRVGPFGALAPAQRLAAEPLLHDWPRHRRRHPSRTAALVARMIAAADRIAKLPYVWGGGHGSFAAGGYDCSGSVSYVLHAAGLLSVPEASGALESFGMPGRGRHVTIYANSGHAWMTINGRRFDTIALQQTGTRWSRTMASTAGYVAVHPRGL